MGMVSFDIVDILLVAGALEVGNGAPICVLAVDRIALPLRGWNSG